MIEQNLQKTDDIDGKEALQISDSDRLHRLTVVYRAFRERQNQCILARGKILEYIFNSRIWLAQDYDSYEQCIADPNGLDTKPRTARLYRLIWRVWKDKLAKIGVEKREINQIDHAKLAFVIRELVKENDRDKLLLILARIQTLTLQQLRDEREEQEFIIFDGTAKAHKWFNEKSGYSMHFSQGKEKYAKNKEGSASAQAWWEIFGNRLVEIKVRLKKQEDKDE